MSEFMYYLKIEFLKSYKAVIAVFLFSIVVSSVLMSGIDEVVAVSNFFNIYQKL